MIFNHKNITNTDITILSLAVPGSKRIYIVERLLICNIDTEDITVDLWLDDGSDQYYLLRTVPQKMTLDFLNGTPFKYEASYGLKIRLAASGTPTADIIFNQL
jgi:hypothetical protein